METSVESSQREVTMSKEEIERMQAKLLESQHVATDKQVWFKLRPSNFNMILIFLFEFQTIIDRLELQCHEMTKNNHAQVLYALLVFVIFGYTLLLYYCSTTDTHIHRYTVKLTHTHTHFASHQQLEKLRWESEEKMQSQREAAEKQRRDFEADLR